MAKKRNETKARAQKRHFGKRLYQRYGILCDRHLIKRIVTDIQNGNATLIEKQSNTRTVFMVEIKGTNVPVVYDKQRHVPVTALPANYERGEIADEFPD